MLTETRISLNLSSATSVGTTPLLLRESCFSFSFGRLAVGKLILMFSPSFLFSLCRIMTALWGEEGGCAVTDYKNPLLGRSLTLETVSSG